MPAFVPMLRARCLRRIGAVLVAFAASSLGASPVQARSAGIEATGCDTCHREGATPTVTLTADPPNPSLGQAVTLTIGVSQTNGATAGFYLTTAYDVPGTFQAFEAGTVASSSGVMHSMPRAGSGGTTTFQARWTASAATGVVFDVYALSANGNKTNRGDGAGSAELELVVGCAGATYYIDQDGDGYGSTDSVYAPRKACVTPAGYAEKSGDCDDFHAEVHPGASELCDLKDNDCDGAVDEDVVPQPFCEDKDGDGHGAPGSPAKMDCKPTAGFAVCDNDCDDRAKTTYPGAAEVCDGFDNDCDGTVDEGVRVVCGVGLCSRYAMGCSTSCTPGTPFAETCNGIDDDCDGVLDNGSNESLCGDATWPCVAGRCVGSGTSGGAPFAGGGNGASAGGPYFGSSGTGHGSGAPAASASSGCTLARAAHGSGIAPFASALMLGGWFLARARRARRPARRCCAASDRAEPRRRRLRRPGRPR